MSKITVVEQAGVTTPSTGQASIYVDASTKKLASKDDAGTVTDYSATPLSDANPENVTKAAPSAGAATLASRADHKHGCPVVCGVRHRV